jgi:beta-carotene 3-hydroxylase
MTTHWLIPIAIVAITVIAMELLAAAVHRHVMHGFGWGWHRSHHDERNGLLETNDLYTMVFAGLSVLLFIWSAHFPALWWVGLGMVVYGILYAMLHDGLVHRRIPFPTAPRAGYLKRLVQAHRLHHSVRAREGCVSFGFLYAPPVDALIEKLRADRRNA